MTISSQYGRHVTLVLLTYTICFGSYALVDVPFWDDWVVLQNGQQGLWEMFQQLGRREQFPLVAPFAYYGRPLLWAVTNFLCWGTVPLSLYGLLRHLDWAPTNAMWAALLTAAMPLNEARFALAMLPYSFSAAFFAAGLYLVAVSVKSGQVLPRLLAALLLYWSFSTNSFLTISWLAPAIVFVLELQRYPGSGIREGAKALYRRFELVLLPLVYWGVKTLLQPAYGLYEGYNAFQMDPLRAILLSILRLPSQAPDPRIFFPTWGHLFEAVVYSLLALVFLFAIVLISKTETKPVSSEARRSWGTVIVLLAAAILALFPYIMVGIIPSFQGLWETRHQTTLALVAGVLGVSVFSAILPVRYVRVASVAALFVFMACDISASRQLLTDVQTTKALLHSPQIAALPSGTMIGLFETTSSDRFFSRSFQFYDASSILNANRPAKDLIALSQHEVTDPDTGAYAASGSDAFPRGVESVCRSIVSRPQYGFGDFVSNGWFADVKLVRNTAPASFPVAVSSAVWSLVSPEAGDAAAVAELSIFISPRPYTTPQCADRCCSSQAIPVDWESVLQGSETP